MLQEGAIRLIAAFENMADKCQGETGLWQKDGSQRFQQDAIFATPVAEEETRMRTDVDAASGGSSRGSHMSHVGVH